VTIRLVRHAKAGSRHNFVGPDDDRPLTKKGLVQAAGIAEVLALQHPTRLLTSPLLRCVETLQPLADAVGLPIEIDARLAEGSSYNTVLELIEQLPEGSVLCSHGDVIPAVIDALLRRGAELASEPDHRKGAIWELERERGEIVRIRAFAPPPDGAD
jgi:broad specificity phosphatase PhoE